MDTDQPREQLRAKRRRVVLGVRHLSPQLRESAAFDLAHPQTAAQAVNNAAAAMATLTVQAATTAAATAINDVRDEVNVIVGEVTNVAIVAIGKAAATVAAAIVEGVVQIIGSVIAGVFEFAAGGDVLMPAATGDHTNLTDRAVMTHEYGHFTLCNLLEKASPATFALAYDDAAVQGIVSGQSVSAAGAILNESFADLITSQVAGGTNYATPIGGGIKVGSEFYCFESNSDCIEHNTTNNDIMSSFNTAVLRDVSLFTDAFDGLMGRPLTFDRPMNGNEWAVTMPGLTLAPNPGQDAHDDVVNLRGNGFRRWIARNGGLQPDPRGQLLPRTFRRHGRGQLQLVAPGARCSPCTRWTRPATSPARPLGSVRGQRTMPTAPPAHSPARSRGRARP